MSELDLHINSFPEDVPELEKHDSALYVQSYEVALASLAYAHDAQNRHQQINSQIVSEQAEEIERLKIDKLTGLPMRAVFEAGVDEWLETHHRQPEVNRGHTIMLIDLDNFKTVNDTAGHSVGDNVLRTVGQALRDSLRENDLAGRYGGEELAVFLPNTTTEDARIVVDRLRQKLSTSQTDGWEKPVSASIGIAGFNHGEHPGDALLRADRAMYYVKASGKDNAAVYGDAGDHALVYSSDR